MTLLQRNGYEPTAASVPEDAKAMVEVARVEGIPTVWDRLAAQEPHCGYCSLGVSCRNCSMGPCRIDPFGNGPQVGVCGAGADLIVARNLSRAIAVGSASHSDHGRDILEVFEQTAKGETSGYRIADEPKLLALAAEWGIETAGRPINDIGVDLADAMFEDFGSRKKALGFVARAPEARRVLWERLGITPRGIDRENVEMLHRTHMGVDSDYANMLLHGLRTSLSDGWGGSMIATELSDVLFGTPQPVMSEVNLGTLKATHVNIALHGHNPLLSDVIVEASSDPELVALAKSKGAEGINLVGLCCTGNELMMRRGVPMAGNHLMQELVMMTGALEAMVVDYQCIMPSVVDVAKCFHTRVITTADKAKIPGATHISFDPAQGLAIGKEIVRQGIEAFPNRVTARVNIPNEPVPMMAGFSVEAILGALGGTPQPLVDAIASGAIRGAVGIVGCSNPKVPLDTSNVGPRQAPHRERRARARDGLRGSGQRQGRADAPVLRLDGGARTSRRLRVAGHPAGAAHGLVRGQHADPRARGGPGQAPRRGHPPAAARRRRSRVVLREGDRDRLLRRRVRDHHGPRCPAADLRHRRRSSTSWPAASTAWSARSSPWNRTRRPRPS